MGAKLSKTSRQDMWDEVKSDKAHQQLFEWVYIDMGDETSPAPVEETVESPPTRLPDGLSLQLVQSWQEDILKDPKNR